METATNLNPTTLATINNNINEKGNKMKTTTILNLATPATTMTADEINAEWDEYLSSVEYKIDEHYENVVNGLYPDPQLTINEHNRFILLAVAKNEKMYVPGTYKSWAASVAERFADTLSAVDVWAEDIKSSVLAKAIEKLSMVPYNEEENAVSLAWEILEDLCRQEQTISERWDKYYAEVREDENRAKFAKIYKERIL